MEDIKKAVSLKNKIVTSIVLILLLLGLLTTAFLKNILYRMMVDGLKDRGSFTASHIASRSIDPLFSQSRQGLKKLLKDEKEFNEDITYIILFDTEEKILAHTFEEEVPASIISAEKVISGNNGDIRIIKLNAEQIYDFTSSVLMRGKYVGKARIGLSDKNARIMVAKVVGGIVIVNFLFAIVVIILGFGLAQLITRPISNITGIIQKISMGHFDSMINLGPKVRCWEVHNCSKVHCPAYKNDGLKCWYVAGTFCRDEVQGDWAKKLGDCKKCEVYQRYSGDEMQKLADAFDIMVRDLKEDQEKLVRTEKLATIGTLASGIGHELRNPLGSIKNAIYYIKDKLNKSSLGVENPKVGEFLEIIDSEIDASSKIISNLLMFARIGKVSFRYSNINQLIEASVSISKIPEKITIVEEFDPKLSEAMIDPDQIREVFINIIKNGSESMPDGGELVIRTGQRTGTIVIEFIDSGYGIKKNELNKIFEPLFTTKAKGIGLGLAVTKAIIEKHSGSIEAESEEGKGTTFRVHLPVKHEME